MSSTGGHRYPFSLRNVEDLLFGRGIDICHESVRLWWNRFGPMLAACRPERRLGAQQAGSVAVARLADVSD